MPLMTMVQNFNDIERENQFNVSANKNKIKEAVAIEDDDKDEDCRYKCREQ